MSKKYAIRYKKFYKNVNRNVNFYYEKAYRPFVYCSFEMSVDRINDDKGMSKRSRDINFYLLGFRTGIRNFLSNFAQPEVHCRKVVAEGDKAREGKKGALKVRQDSDAGV